MTRKDLIRAAARRAGVTQEVARNVLLAAFDAMNEALVDKQPVQIQGFGSIKPVPPKPVFAPDFFNGGRRLYPGKWKLSFAGCPGTLSKMNSCKEESTPATTRPDSPVDAI